MAKVKIRNISLDQQQIDNNPEMEQRITRLKDAF